MPVPSPRSKSFAERFAESFRRERLGERHLRNVPAELVGVDARIERRQVVGVLISDTADWPSDRGTPPGQRL